MNAQAALADLTTAIEAAQDKARAAHDALRAVMHDAPAASMEESIAWTAAQNVATVIRDLAAIRERL